MGNGSSAIEKENNPVMRFRSKAIVALALTAAITLSACSKPGPAGPPATNDTTTLGPPVTLNLVGYSVAEAANAAAATEWARYREGSNVTFKTSYGASGDQSRAVQNGLKADIVHFSVESDITRLVPDIIDPSWNSGPTKGIISSSIVVFAVRPGNPKNIRTWDDLIKPGVGIVTPNPASSGAARWNALAAWGQVIASGGTEDQAKEYVTKLYNNAVALPSSGRDATTAFLGGTGDVFLTYENEAILAKQSGEAIDWAYPDTTLLIENPAAVTKTADPKATAYLNFVLSPAGQRAFALKGYRPVVSGVDTSGIPGVKDAADPFPAPKKLLTIAKDFGDWKTVSKKFFDANTGIIVLIIAGTGKK
jgi:sulfate transport system substrate-binding protein